MKGASLSWIVATTGSFYAFQIVSKEYQVEPVIDDVRLIIARQLKIPIESLHHDTKLRDLGVELLDFIEIVFALEEKFDVSIPYNANEMSAAGEADSSPAGSGKLETIEQISAAVKMLLDAKAPV